jgi:CheY-like chemotaxis protein
MDNNKSENSNSVDKSNSLNNNDNKPLILLVEDDAINAMVIKKFLSINFKVDVASKSTESIEMAEANTYSLLLMDINLGRGMNGIDVLLEIRKMPKYANTPIIASTAYTMKGDKERLLQAGFDDYISKPYTMHEIILKVQEHVTKKVE